MAKQDKKDAVVEIKTAEDLQSAFPELVEQIIAEFSKPQEQTIETLEQLKQAYPELIEQLSNEQKKLLTDFFGNRTADQIKEHFPALYKRIAESIMPKATVVSSKDGFVLNYKDPFAAGALRVYKQITGNDAIELPCTVPYKDKAAKRVIENYLLRSRGGCDKDRTKAAEEALKKCK